MRKVGQKYMRVVTEQYLAGIVLLLYCLHYRPVRMQGVYYTRRSGVAKKYRLDGKSPVFGFDGVSTGSRSRVGCLLNQVHCCRWLGGDMMAPTALKGPRFSSEQNCACACLCVLYSVKCYACSCWQAPVFSLHEVAIWSLIGQRCHSTTKWSQMAVKTRRG